MSFEVGTSYSAQSVPYMEGNALCCCKDSANLCRRQPADIKLTLYPLMATIVAIWPNSGFCRISKFNSCIFTTLILRNFHHWLVHVFIFDF